MATKMYKEYTPLQKLKVEQQKDLGLGRSLIHVLNNPSAKYNLMQYMVPLFFKQTTL